MIPFRYREEQFAQDIIPPNNTFKPACLIYYDKGAQVLLHHFPEGFNLFVAFVETVLAIMPR